MASGVHKYDAVVPLVSHLRRILGELRGQLTAGERFAAYSYLLLTSLLPPLAVGLLLLGPGSTRPVGIGLLLVALVLLAVPISPILRARVRRREERSSEGESVRRRERTRST